MTPEVIPVLVSAAGGKRDQLESGKKQKLSAGRPETGNGPDRRGIRINLFLSKAGVCSRREADRLIAEGKVTVDGEPALPGTRVLEGQEVRLAGKLLEPEKQEVILAVHKPRGVVCTTDRRWNDILLEDIVQYPQRVFSAGRLDKESEGLILMTNQGQLADRLMRASMGHEKEYIVTVDRPVTDLFLYKMEKGIYLPELQRKTLPCRAVKTGTYEFHLILVQGMNRQIRRMCSELGYHVKRLVRIRIRNIRLEDLPCGKWRHLTEEEIKTLKKGL